MQDGCHIVPGLLKAQQQGGIHACTRRQFSTYNVGMQVHIVFIPKFHRKSLFGLLRRDLGSVLRELARQKDSWIEEGHMVPDHVHMLVSIPPKHKVCEVVGYIKGKSAIWIARHCEGRVRNFTGQAFWARGYYVSTVGRDEQMIREYIKNQEEQDRRDDGQLSLPLG